MIPNSKPFAWQGIFLKVPQEWDLGAIEGDYREGYFRLDDPEDIRLEVKWRREKHKVDLGKVLENYLANLKDRAKRKKLAFLDNKPREELTKIYLRDKEVKFFSWKTNSPENVNANGEIFGFVSQCNRCHTVMMTQTFLKEKDSILIPEILKTLEDHSVSDSIQWAAYDFIFFLPEFFSLEKCSLKSGYLEFNFSTKAGTAEIKIRRWGLANLLLKDVTLEQWASGVAPKVLRNKIKPSSRRDEGSHEILEGSVRRWKWNAFYVRHCRETNKFYALDYAGKKDEELFKQIYSKIQCH